MSAPDTNIEKQTRRHKGPLIGIPLAVGLAAAAFVLVLTWTQLSSVDARGPQAGTVLELEG